MITKNQDDAMPHLIQQGKCSFPVPGIGDAENAVYRYQHVYAPNHFNLEHGQGHYIIKHNIHVNTHTHRYIYIYKLYVYMCAYKHVQDSRGERFSSKPV